DDTATYFAMTDRVMEHGRSLAHLAPSTYEATLATSLALGYPTGSLMPLGIGHVLLSYDVAWLYQPYLTFMAAMLGLTLYALLERLVSPRWLRAVFAVVAAQAAVLYGYVLWGGVKEVAGAWLLALVAALVPWTLGRGRRAVLPLAAACATLACVESLPGSVWLAPLFLAVIAYVAWRRTRPVVEQAVVFAVATAVLSIPAFVAYNQWRHHLGGFRSSDELGNLIGPLSGFQVFGIWPSGDFRVEPDHRVLTYVLIAVVIAAALGGAWWAWRREAWGVLVYAVLAAVGALAIVGLSSPWVGGKALAIAAPAFLALALAGCGALVAKGRFVEASVAALLIGAGVLWSNALQYHDVWLAPRGQLHELEAIGHRFAGVSPALMTTYEPYGVRHFLRNSDPEGASELRRRFDYLRNGKTLDKGGSADIDRFRLDQVLVYRMLVLRRGPAASRPPSVYNLASSGRYYETWVRPVHPPRRIVEHLSLGDATQADGVARCSDVLRLAREARGGSLLYAIAPEAVPVTTPPLSGTLDADTSLASGGRYTAWLAGDWYGNATVWVDGRKVGSKREELNWPGLFTDLGTIDLSPGSHRVRITVDKGGWHPGSGGASYSFGPLTLSPLDTRRNEVDSVPPSQARSLCGRRLDWIEAVR
ncbi:MAG TPA: hypothetical protein VE757_02095, partial [Gaiellaceae bacterium]|nr:hypothetical protein [Gaiellaceae bacterium]